MLKKAQDSANLGWYEEIDPWTGRPTLDGDNIGGIVSFRAGKQADLRNSGARGYYDEAVNPMVQLVHAELQVLLAAFPDQPIHVAKLDIRNYFTKVSHDVLKSMMSGLGMTGDGLNFLQRFMNVPWLVNGQPQPAQRGVPMEQQMSHWLCETLLRLLERHVHENSHVRIIRQIDDICLLAPDAGEITKAWNAVANFLADVGLSVNESKCGCVTLNGDQTLQLADSTPSWGMLQLNADATWSIHESSFESFLESTRHQIESRNSVMSKVLSYNEHMKFLTTSVGLAMDLGEPHRTAANTACVRFEDHLFADHGITELITRLISERYTKHAVDLPESWFAWPITAGGLSLRLLSIVRGQYQLAFDERSKTRKTVPEEQPDDWQWKSQQWTEFYEDHLVALERAKCRDSARMNQLVESFIRRGKSLSGGKQEGLSEYWRWVLSIHGPVILDAFGTFEFLLSDLVPLQLIHEKLLQRGAILTTNQASAGEADTAYSQSD
ncbi:MAG: reverse transcriptase domain-containing protein [Planctomycetaceae bacterium]|nr:reverse transcriptase domain-containing protein [Planctomycetaceae bacterium]